MAKRKALFGVSNYHKRTPKKRPGRIRKKHGPRANKRKKYRGQGRQVKPIMITLMYLTFGGDIKLDSFEIHSSCSSWFHNNVKIVENKKRTLFSSHVYHEYKGKKVIGYVCGGHEPQ